MPPHEELLRFCCPECGAHLAVKSTMAGVKGPCPRCGKKILSPEGPLQPIEEEELKVRMGREISGREVPKRPVDIKPMPGGRPKVGDPVQRLPERSTGSSQVVVRSELPQKRRRERRTVSAVGGGLPGESDKEKNIDTLKILGALLLAVIVVVLVTWWLNNQGP